MEILHPVDVGAANGRLRAIDRRPYEFYRKILVFCNTPFCYKIEPNDKLQFEMLKAFQTVGAIINRPCSKMLRIRPSSGKYVILCCRALNKRPYIHVGRLYFKLQ